MRLARKEPDVAAYQHIVLTSRNKRARVSRRCGACKRWRRFPWEGLPCADLLQITHLARQGECRARQAGKTAPEPAPPGGRERRLVERGGSVTYQAQPADRLQHYRSTAQLFQRLFRCDHQRLAYLGTKQR